MLWILVTRIATMKSSEEIANRHKDRHIKEAAKSSKAPKIAKNPMVLAMRLMLR